MSRLVESSMGGRQLLIRDYKSRIEDVGSVPRFCVLSLVVDVTTGLDGILTSNLFSSAMCVQRSH